MFDGAQLGHAAKTGTILQERTARRSQIILVGEHSNLAGFAAWAERRPLSVVRWIRIPLPTAPLSKDPIADPFRGLPGWIDVRHVVVYGFSGYMVGRTALPTGLTPAGGTAGQGFIDGVLARMAAVKKEADLRRGRLVRQAECLAGYSPLARRVAMGLVRVHAWFHIVETGVMQRHDPRDGWVALEDDDLFDDAAR